MGQPQADTRPRRVHTRTIVLAIATLGIAVVGTIGIARYYSTMVLHSNTPGDTTISGDKEEDTLSITANSTIHIPGNQDTVTLSLNPNVRIGLDIPEATTP